MNKLRCLAAFVLGVSLLAVAPSAAAAEPDETSQVPTRERVDLRVELAAGDRALGSMTQLVDWGTETRIALDADGHEHAVQIEVAKVDADGKKLRVKIGYVRDGQAMIESTTVQASPKRKKIVRSADGSVAVALTLAPTQVAAEPPAPPHRIELPADRNDPLAGV